uniref:Uncharacterized protein n=1 Tax=Candidatus Kentrum sp. SD TaxID=2126332 RepID=A0A450YQ56_9GAMM|nr:MAG: hypothetical protein BECKSD772F_GA0070984_11526 [Candidatus Kentron sp. SD]VFK44467.1 MAG: hypothetical protein BECKSD772E_GA0070983_103814 [Candidatus Kentron sp. SD]
MLNPAYSIEQFRSNFSQITTIKELISLIKGDPTANLLIEMRSLPLDFRALSLDFSWDVKPDNFRIATKIELSFKLWINSVLYEAPCWQELSPKGFADLEPALLKALKQAIASVGGSHE